MEKYLYAIGLILAIIYILSGFDDFIWDLVAIFKGVFDKKKEKEVELDSVFNEPPKLRAVMIAAWQESNVIEDVITHFIKTTIYPTSQYHVFVGVYPNDPETIEAVRRLENKFSNVHCIINYMPGPTTKAQNLNYVVKQVIKFENEKSWTFSSFTVHDSEDVVSPYELRLSNYYLKYHDGIQFPVFPLIEYPTLKNFFKNITTNTYADEFAENHYLTMYFRDKANAFVPSAGTGFVLNRDIIFESEDLNFLPKASLTEDYQLALDLYVRNKDFKYLLDTMPYVDQDYKVKRSFVSTRSMFPNTFKQAVRQKKRWITGITMQTINMRSIFELKDISFVGKYSLYRDQKAKFGNLIAFIGYPVYIYFIISLFTSLPPIYPLYSFSWRLSLFVTVMMIERLLFRMISMYNVYGLKSALLASFFPPILPFRYVWGNIINFTATFQSFLEKYEKQRSHRKSSKKTKKVKWDKTEHTFLSQLTLDRFYMRLGDILLKRNYIKGEDLAKVLKVMENEKDIRFVGSYLLDNEYINEEQLLYALADLNDTVYLHDENLLKYLDYDLLPDGLEYYKENMILPILSKKDTIVIAICHKVTHSKRKLIEEKFSNFNVYFTFVKEDALLNSLLNLGMNTPKVDTLFSLFKSNKIDWQQVLLTWNYILEYNCTQKEALRALGLFSEVSEETLTQ